MRHRLPLLALLIAFLSTPSLLAQGDTISRSPHAVELRPIWTRYGATYGIRQLGDGVTSIGDINGDSLMDFAVMNFDSVEYFLGGRPAPSNTPFQVRPKTFGGNRDFVDGNGDFWGTGHTAIVNIKHPDLLIYRTESGRISDTIAARLNRNWRPDYQLFIDEVVAADLDNDGDDELIIGSASPYHDGVTDYHAEIFIFEGGPGFQLDTPAVILRDTDRNDGGGFMILRVADVDGDAHLDVVYLSRYRSDGSSHVNIHFGSGSVDGFSINPDRTAKNASLRLQTPDVNGDSTADIYLSGGYVFISGPGRNARTRSLDTADADVKLHDAFPWISMPGPLNDSTGRFDMIGRSPGALHAFSGGPNGPDLAYDAYFNATEWDRYHAPLGDVNGDGWDDVIFSSNYYPHELSKTGVAIILSGGAYIPRDSLPPSAIRDVPLGRHRDAFTIWPLPATDVINVAWRGDLANTPRDYAIHDELGRLVERGEVGFGQSHVTWQCSDAPPGVYIITVHDHSSAMILSERVLKQ